MFVEVTGEKLVGVGILYYSEIFGNHAPSLLRKI